MFRTMKKKRGGDTTLYTYAVHVRVLEGRNLEAEDGKESTAQPYVRAELTQPQKSHAELQKKIKKGRLEKNGSEFESIQTGVAKNTCNPVWNTDCTLFASSQSQFLKIEVFDWKRLAKHISLGQCHISLAQISTSANHILHQWFDLFDNSGDRKRRGRVYLIVALSKLSREPVFNLSSFTTSTSEFMVARDALLNAEVCTDYTPLAEVTTRAKPDEAYKKLGQEKFPELAEPTVTRANLTGLPAETSVWMASWNCGNANPPDSLSPWLPPPDAGYDVVAVGSQECEYPRRKDMMGNPTFASCGRDWISHLMWHFGSEYQLVTYSFLLQIRLVVFVRKALASRIEDVNVSSVATGIGNVVGNKGGVSVSFSLNQTSLCFINAHLAAHQDKVSQRNKDAEMIINGLAIPGFDSHMDVGNRFDYVFFCGDLNYRCNFGNQPGHTPPTDVFELMVKKIKEGGPSMSQIFGTDQLSEEMRQQRVFCGWREGNCDCHRPTFKVLRTAELQYTPQRSPAWCDRILWKTAPKKRIVQTLLDSAEKIETSDHKPVYCSFSLLTWLLPPAIDPRMGKASLEFLDIDCHIYRPYPSAEIKAQKNSADLPINPYFKFTSPEFVTMLQIPSIKHGEINGGHAKWADCNMVAELSCNNVHRMREGFIHAQLKNKLEHRKISRSSETIGFGLIPFLIPESAQLVREKDPNDGNKPCLSYKYKFSTDISIGGLNCATMTGEIKLTWSQLGNATVREIAKVREQLSVTHQENDAEETKAARELMASLKAPKHNSRTSIRSGILRRQLVPTETKTGEEDDGDTSDEDLDMSGDASGRSRRSTIMKEKKAQDAAIPTKNRAVSLVAIRDETNAAPVTTNAPALPSLLESDDDDNNEPSGQASSSSDKPQISAQLIAMAKNANAAKGLALGSRRTSLAQKRVSYSVPPPSNVALMPTVGLDSSDESSDDEDIPNVAPPSLQTVPEPLMGPTDADSGFETSSDSDWIPPPPSGGGPPQALPVDRTGMNPRGSIINQMPQSIRAKPTPPPPSFAPDQFPSSSDEDSDYAAPPPPAYLPPSGDLASSSDEDDIPPPPSGPPPEQKTSASARMSLAQKVKSLKSSTTTVNKTAQGGDTYSFSTRMKKRKDLDDE